MDPIFFSNQGEFREWLENNHDKEKELWVGYYKKATGIPSQTWSESVDQALCFGWIDGIRKSVDEKRYKIRFTPRREDSIWSAVNVAKMKELIEKGLMRPPGLAKFERRNKKKQEIYSYERKKTELPKEYIARIKATPGAWEYFEKLAPSYKKASINWVVNAKREETRIRRLGQLIESSVAGLKIPPLRRGK